MAAPLVPRPTFAPKKGIVSRDDRHGTADNYWSFIGDMWRCLGAVMADNAHVVIRIGSRKIAPEALKRGLTGCAQFSGRKIEAREPSSHGN